jgi:transposase
MELGWGGISKVSELTGKSMDTIRKGISEIKSKSQLELKESGRIRKAGGGRKRIASEHPTIQKIIESILGENTAGDPASALKWTNKSTYVIAKELNSKKQKVSEDTVGRIIKQMGYTLQPNRKSKESGSSSERDSQFRYIDVLVKRHMRKKMPVIFVDTKKKELVGNFKNSGRRWLKKGQAEVVNIYDFENLSKGKAISYGIHELTRNNGFVNVGINHDTSEFAVDSIKRWWRIIGKHNYQAAKGLLISADCGSSNSSRSKLWKYFLQKFADGTKLRITVCHYPPGTSKWNKVEHMMFSFISVNWGGRPLTSYEVIVNLIEGTTAKKGLKISAKSDRRIYAKVKKVPEAGFKMINLRQHEINPEWNYTISPRI